MRPTLYQMKWRLADENGLELPPSRSSDVDEKPTDSTMDKVMAWIRKNPDEVSDIIEEVIESSEYKEPFYEYFNDDDKFDELVEMHKTDIDRFYDIVKSYEMFLNVCAKCAGYTKLNIRLRISDLLN